jgi:hypothetical protein
MDRPKPSQHAEQIQLDKNFVAVVSHKPAGPNVITRLEEVLKRAADRDDFEFCSIILKAQKEVQARLDAPRPRICLQVPG